MDKHRKRKIREERRAITKRFAEQGFERRRTPREEVVEILTEGLWTLICRGRGPASERFASLRDSIRCAEDLRRHDALEEVQTI